MQHSNFQSISNQIKMADVEKNKELVPYEDEYSRLAKKYDRLPDPGTLEFFKRHGYPNPDLSNAHVAQKTVDYFLPMNK
jgi:hypothetical protein